MSDFLLKLTKAAGAGERIKTGEPMKWHTTFRTGGPAAYFATPSCTEELSAIIKLCRQENMPYYILGNGSNLLISDKGYDGVMISMGEGFSQIWNEGSQIRAGAGALLSRIARQALALSLTGFEFAAGIPGTLGGAVVMNAGAYGGEMKQVLVSAQVLTKEGEIRTVPAEELELGYRTSSIQKEEQIVLSALLKLELGDKSRIRARMEELAEKRKEKQPLEYPSAGSTFKRPEGYYAGKLIMEAGLRGFSIGGAQVSEKHCGFIINRENATSSDIIELCRQVRDKVKAKFGVELEMEIKRLGEF